MSCKTDFESGWFFLLAKNVLRLSLVVAIMEGSALDRTYGH